MSELRRDLPELPQRFRALPIDARGYPVPFFVAWVNGEPDFRVADAGKHLACVKRNLCWLCGQPLGRYYAFVIGPMCAINRVSSEPPQHRDCADFAARACPFLARPKAQRRDANLPDERDLPPGEMIRRNPGVALVWVTREYRREAYPGQGSIYRLGNPTEALWYAEGRAATRAEVLASIYSGYPLLLGIAEREGAEAVFALSAMTTTAFRYLPAAP